MRIICAVELKLLNQVSDPEELYDRMCAYWMNVGVVGALLGSTTYGSFAGPPECNDEMCVCKSD